MISHLETEITISGARVPVVVLFSLEESGRLFLLETKVRSTSISAEDNRRLLKLAKLRVAEIRAGPDLLSTENPIVAGIAQREAIRL